VETEPMPGENLVLSIDANIQYMAERALDAQMEKTHAAHGTVVVQDPHTGQILALAIAPRFNPNDQHHMDASVLTNLAVSDVYEPGSTFKLVTYAAAIDGAGVQPTDMVDCQGGSMTMFGRTLHDDKSDHYGVITVQQALEHSSDVGAAKMALKLGANRFYGYIKGFGFGERSGVELPSETRGLLRAPRNWGATSILSVSIGQEIGVTPVQLVTMVSAIANGGVYMPPHILLQSTDELKGDTRLQAEAFHPQNQLPATLPDGAHRVITELTSGKMRSMMQGIVVEGTGKAAALNGYSSAGKTGTAQKVDPETHTYSHTKLVASFAGFAPVSNPAIAVAVVIDTPQGSEAQRYGAYVSAPVFAQVAQQVLEYLGVPHDQPLKTVKELQASSVPDAGADGPSENSGDLNAMFDAINNLPADDPLRAASTTPVEAASATATANPAQGSHIINTLPAKILASYVRGNVADSTGDASTGRLPGLTGIIVPKPEAMVHGGIAVDAGPEVAVPSFTGADLRKVVETAASLGLRVEPLGSGVEREQFPAPGTKVPVGTNVVVRFSR
jgi:cell division protein FtsI (penicillin-binding protein 3)